MKNFYKNIGVKVKFKGFTIAEVLIAIAVLGTVASLALPNLLITAQEEEFRSFALKTYSDLSMAIQKMVNERGGIWDNKPSDITQLSMNMKDEFKDYFKYAEEGKMSDIQQRPWMGYRSSTVIAGLEAERYGLVLTNGVILRFYSVQECSDSTPVPTIPNCGSIIADINGGKGPNMFGRDVFAFQVLKDKTNYKLNPSTAIGGYACEVGSSSQLTSYGCTEKVIMSEAMP